MERRKTKKQMVTAPPNCAFWVHDGPIVHNLKELKDALAKTVSDKQFKHHVTREKNDFVNWIADVLQDKKCANSMKRVRTRKSATNVISKCLTSDYKRS